MFFLVLKSFYLFILAILFILYHRRKITTRTILNYEIQVICILSIIFPMLSLLEKNSAVCLSKDVEIEAKRFFQITQNGISLPRNKTHKSNKYTLNKVLIHNLHCIVILSVFLLTKHNLSYEPLHFTYLLWNMLLLQVTLQIQSYPFQFSKFYNLLLMLLLKLQLDQLMAEQFL